MGYAARWLTVSTEDVYLAHVGVAARVQPILGEVSEFAVRFVDVALLWVVRAASEASLASVYHRAGSRTDVGRDFGRVRTARN